MKRLFVCLCLISLTACGHFRQGGSDLRPDPREVQRDLESIQNLESAIQAGSCETIFPEIQNFQIERPRSVYFQASRFLEALCLEEADRPQEARELYRGIKAKTFGVEPGLAARAEWRLSFTAEAMGDNTQAFAHLLGAEKQSSLLAPTVAWAEIPARKALLLKRLGRYEEAKVAAQAAEQGLRALLSRDEGRALTSSGLARLYYALGESQTSSVNEENFQAYLDAQSESQRHLLQSIAKNDPVWSKKALQLLLKNYSDYLRVLSLTAGDTGYGSLVAAKQTRERQILLLGPLSQLFDQALARRPPESSSMNEFESVLFPLLTQLSDEARKVLYATTETTVLTEESRLLNSIRRRGRILDVAPVADPNL